MKNFILLLVLTAFSSPSLSIVTRHDVPAEKYLVTSAPKYLVDMPGEGHGVLIKPQWILTVAHLIFSDYSGMEISINGKNFKIEKVIIHPKAKKPDSFLFEGNAKPLMDFMKTTSDIALIKLSESVEQVTPISLYTKSDEKGKVVTAFGRGATGDGLKGSIFESKRKKILRTMNNIIDFTEGNWVSISLDKGERALALEGIDGSGDSGGPLVVSENGSDYLIGLFSWDYVEGELKEFKPGIYGGSSFQVRISSYINWINKTIQNNTESR